MILLIFIYSLFLSLFSSVLDDDSIRPSTQFNTRLDNVGLLLNLDDSTQLSIQINPVPFFYNKRV